MQANSINLVDLILVFINLIVWIGPLILTNLYKQKIPLYHPISILPIWVIYSLLNSMIQLWTPWMGETEYGILKTIDYNIKVNPFFSYSDALAINAIGGFFYNLTCILILKKYQVNSYNKLPVFNNRNYKYINIKLLILMFILFIPNYLIPNEKLGTYWTFPVAMSASIIPLLIYLSNKNLGLISLILCMIMGKILKSKAGLIFPIIPFILYYYSILNFKFNKDLVLIFIGIFLLFFGLYLGGFGFDFRRLLHRDYSFEIFVLLVNSQSDIYFGNLLSTTDLSPINCWTCNELLKGIPYIFYPGKVDLLNPSLIVSKFFANLDYISIPNAYFNRYLFFAGQYDLGLVGTVLESIIIALFITIMYIFSIWISKKICQEYPLIFYVFAASIGTYFVSVGGLTYGLINTIIPIFLIVIFISLVNFYYFIFRENV